MTGNAGAAAVRDAPMTLGQKFQWYLERGIADSVRRLPDGCDTEFVAAVVTAVQNRFEILRTTIEPSEDGYGQRVHDHGEALMVVDAGADIAAAVSALAEDFSRETAGRTGRFLARFHLLRYADERHLYVIADSVAADRAFFGLLDLALDIASGESGEIPDGPQPSELARHENSADGLAEREAAKAYLRGHYETAPPTAPRADTGAAGRYYRCTSTLPHADRIFGRIIDVTGRLPSAVALGAFGALMSAHSGSRECTVNVSMENRHTRELRTARCGTAQRAPVVLRRQGDLLDDAVTAAEYALAEAYPIAGRYDALDLLAQRRVAEAERGVCLVPALAYNFNPPLRGWTALLESVPAEYIPDFAPEREAVITPTRETSYEYAASLSVRWRDEHTVALSVHGDSEVLTPRDCAAVLRGLAACLVAFARGDEVVDVLDTAHASGLPTRNSPHDRGEVRS